MRSIPCAMSLLFFIAKPPVSTATDTAPSASATPSWSWELRSRWSVGSAYSASAV